MEGSYSIWLPDLDLARQNASFPEDSRHMIGGDVNRMHSSVIAFSIRDLMEMAHSCRAGGARGRKSRAHLSIYDDCVFFWWREDSCSAQRVDETFTPNFFFPDCDLFSPFYYSEVACVYLHTHSRTPVKRRRLRWYWWESCLVALLKRMEIRKKKKKKKKKRERELGIYRCCTTSNGRSSVARLFPWVRGALLVIPSKAGKSLELPYMVACVCYKEREFGAPLYLWINTHNVFLSLVSSSSRRRSSLPLLFAPNGIYSFQSFHLKQILSLCCLSTTFAP